MAELAVKTKELDFHLEQVQDFTPTPMTVSTETWYTGFDPYTLEPVFSAKTPKEKQAQRMFFFWYKPEERRAIEQELRRIGRSDLIPKLYNQPLRRWTPTKERDTDHNTSFGGYNKVSRDGKGGQRQPKSNRSKEKVYGHDKKISYSESYQQTAENRHSRKARERKESYGRRR